MISFMLKDYNALNVISNSVAIIHDTNTILELVTKGVGSGFVSQRMLNISPFKDKVKILNIKNDLRELQKEADTTLQEILEQIVDQVILITSEQMEIAELKMALEE